MATISVPSRGRRACLLVSSAGILLMTPSAVVGEAFVWGDDRYGQLGLNVNDGTDRRQALPVLSHGALRGHAVAAAAAGGDTTLLVTTTGLVFGMGLNTYGHLGDGTTVNRTEAVPMILTALEGRAVVSADCGDTHSLLLTTDGRVYATGAGSSGQLGDGTATRRLQPVAVDATGVMAGKTVTAVACGAEFSLALASTGELFSWGRNNVGQLGNGTFTDSSVPVRVVQTGALAGRTVTAISAGSEHCMALTNDGRIFAWGENFGGKLGDGTETDQAEPVAVTTSGVLAGITVTAIAAGGNHSLALDNAGRAYAWGVNSSGQLGDGSSTSYRPTPVRVGATGTVLNRIAAGTFHSMALSNQDQLFGWGDNSNGEIHQTGTGFFRSPRAAAPAGQLIGRRILALSAGIRHNALVTELPAVAVEQPAGTPLADAASTVDFGSVAVGRSTSLTFTVRNTGGDLLTPGIITIDGAHASDFTVTAAPAAVVNGAGATRFTVRFAPMAAGLRTAQLHLPSNDSDVTVFDINLTGSRP